LTSDTSAAILLSDFDNRGTDVAENAASQDVLRGTLDLLVLKTLELEPMHGWGISQRIEELSEALLQVGQGSLYPALQRLEERGWIDAEWRTTEQNRRAKYYSLTATGRKALGRETAEWRRYVGAVDLILGSG
jgi:PadR family transcriptional regulator, regulatory protein PadR